MIDPARNDPDPGACQRVPGQVGRGAASLLLAAAWLPAIAADPLASKCAVDAKWIDFTFIAMTAQADAHASDGGLSMKIEQTVYDDGMHIVGSDARRRSEVIALSLGEGLHVLASEPTAPREFGEVGMIYELPLAAVSRQFHGLCEMVENRSYRVDIRQGQDSVTGSLMRQGDSISFALQDTRDRDHMTYVGSVGYQRPRGALPTTLAIQGWSIFPPGTVDPGQATTTPFKTLGEFEASLKPAPK